MRPQIRETNNHPFIDPWAHRHKMRSRIAKADPKLGQDGWYVWIWDRDGVGWVYAGGDESTQKLLNEEPSYGNGVGR